MLKNKTLLILEDDLECLDGLFAYLEGKFASMIKVSDGLAALEEYKKNKPDYIIADIEMPKMNGLDFIETIRRHDRITPVAIMSAYSYKDYLFKSASLHLEDYIVKPVTSSKLQKLLERFAANSAESALINKANNISYSFVSKTVITPMAQINLTNMEINLLELLLKNRERFVSYFEIEHQLYQHKEMNKNMPKLLIRNLRKKIPHINIISKINVGYCLLCQD